MKSLTLLLPLVAIFGLTACGGGGEGAVGAGFGQPQRILATTLCDKGSNDTGAVRYVSIDGVCTAMFAPMLDAPALVDAPATAAQATEVAPLRAAAQATPVEPLRAAQTPFTWTSFLAWAVTTYPQYFRGSTQDGVYEGYTYRYWPSTGHYLALRDTNKLYVLGPATDGDILYIGTLEALSCTVYPANCAATGTVTTGTTSTTGSTATTGSADIAGSVATTASIVSTAPYISTIESTTDEDWFAVNLTAGTSYIFNLEGASTGKGTLADPFLRLYDSAGRLVTSNDDVSYPSNLNSRITYTPTASARFYVSAGAFSSIGTYQLTASVGSSSSTGGGTNTGGGNAATTFRLTTGTIGSGQGSVSPASGTAPRGTVGTIYAQPQFFSEFLGWTSRSTSCVGALLGCEINLQSDQYLEARFEPAVFESSFDASYSIRSTQGNGTCIWQVTWSGTKVELRFILSGNTYIGRLRVTGQQRSVVTSAVGTNCSSGTTNLDSTFTVDGYSDGAGYSARVLVFDGVGDEYLTLSTGLHLPGPNIGGVAGFVPVSMVLNYTGTGRSGTTGSLFKLLTRYGR